MYTICSKFAICSFWQWGIYIPSGHVTRLAGIMPAPLPALGKG
jgi:hypothetical protein